MANGDLISPSSDTFDHAEIRDAVLVAFHWYLRSRPIGRVAGMVDCKLSEDTVAWADVSFSFTNADRSIPGRQVPIPFAPDIAVEVLSPPEAAIDVNRKVRDYLNAGAQEVWLLDGYNGQAAVRTSNAMRVLLRNDILETPLLEGFSLPLAELFQRTGDPETRSSP